MLDPALIEVLNQIARQNDELFEQSHDKVEITNTLSSVKQSVLKLNSDGALTEIHAHASHSSHRSHNSHSSHHSHRSSLV